MSEIALPETRYALKARSTSLIKSWAPVPWTSSWSPAWCRTSNLRMRRMDILRSYAAFLHSPALLLSTSGVRDYPIRISGAPSLEQRMDDRAPEARRG
jgi:hypothetical protein